MKDEQMLQYIYKTAEMGKEGIQSILHECKDPAMLNALKKQLRSYNEIYATSVNHLNARGVLPHGVGVFEKMGVSMASAMQTMNDHSPAKIAELMIRGTTTGLTKSIKHINHFNGNDSKVLELAHELKSVEEQGIEEMKTFL